MDVDARLWRSFTTVAEELHYGRAAERLHITQPALSRQIRDLERALGVTLFDRTSRRVVLSQAGRAGLPGGADALARGRGHLGHAQRTDLGCSGVHAWL